MQTFIPVAGTYEEMATYLDRQRLNKQALEGWQILLTLLQLDPQGNYRNPKGWVNHPAVKMWRGHEVALHNYVQAMVAEWKSRGYNSTIGDKARATLLTAIDKDLIDMSYSAPPVWVSDRNMFELVASSHRVALLNKNYEWYSQFGWTEDTGICPETYNYIWPDVDGNYFTGEQRNDAKSTVLAVA